MANFSAQAWPGQHDPAGALAPANARGRAGRVPGPAAGPAEQLATYENRRASPPQGPWLGPAPRTPSARELTRELAGWGLPPAAPASAAQPARRGR